MTKTTATETTFARAYRGRVDHIVSGDATRCGLPVKGMATWPASLGSRVDFRPTCEGCRNAQPAPTAARTYGTAINGDILCRTCGGIGTGCICDIDADLADKRADALALIAISEAGSR